jgi:tRNA 2-thiouridine synthesizing protein E
MRTDRDGYLLELDDWSPYVARALARNEGIVLSDDHWTIIDLLRAFHAETGISPSMRPLVKLVGQQLGADKGTSLYLLKLFPGNAAKLAAKIAGLPRPTNCL